MNWVPMARHGLILWENKATGSRKVSKYLPGLWDAICFYCIGLVNLGLKMVSQMPRRHLETFLGPVASL